MFLSAADSSDLSLWTLVPLSLVIGIVLGVVGGMVGLVLGNLRLPFVFFILDSASVASGTNIGISGIAAGGGVWRHWRERAIDWRVFWVIAPTSFAGAMVGGFFSERVEPGTLLVLFSAVILYGGIDALRQGRALRIEHRAGAVAPRTYGTSLTRKRIATEAVIGLVIGGLGGLVGLILGSMRLPAMLRILNMDPRTAVGTNMAVGLVTGISGVIGHTLGGGVNWTVLGVMGASAALGSYYGAKLTGVLSPQALLTALGVVLLLVSGTMAWRAFSEF